VKYRITHTTFYHYSQPVGVCQSEARLQPRIFSRQQCHNSRFDIKPAPMDFSERIDFFGNRVAYFAIQQPHTQLIVTAISEVTIFPRQNNLDLLNQMTWEQVRSLLQESPLLGQSQSQLGQSQIQNQDQTLEVLDARQYVLDSPMVIVTPELADYAQGSFLPNRALVDVVHDLMQRIYKDFTYDPAFTTIATPLSEVLSFRRGVCQDLTRTIAYRVSGQSLGCEITCTGYACSSPVSLTNRAPNVWRACRPSGQLPNIKTGMSAAESFAAKRQAIAPVPMIRTELFGS